MSHGWLRIVLQDPEDCGVHASKINVSATGLERSVHHYYQRLAFHHGECQNESNWILVCGSKLSLIW